MAAERRHSGGWTDEELDDVHEHEAGNIDRRNRRELMEHRLAANDWCLCGVERCWPPGFAYSVYDLQCCQQDEQIKEVCQEVSEGKAAHKCITDHPGFQFYCLDSRFLQNTYYLHKAFEHDDTRTSINNRKRYTAFRNFTSWVHGRLGQHKRIPIPMCVTKKIRQKFPSPDGNYTGFQEIDFNLI